MRWAGVSEENAIGGIKWDCNIRIVNLVLDRGGIYSPSFMNFTGPKRIYEPLKAVEMFYRVLAIRSLQISLCILIV